MTTIREDYLMVTAEGEYITMTSVSTMVGYRREYGTTNDIDKAAMLSSASYGPAYRELRDKFPGWKKVPCKITRTVELITEELNFNLPPKE